VLRGTLALKRRLQVGASTLPVRRGGAVTESSVLGVLAGGAAGRVVTAAISPATVFGPSGESAGFGGEGAGSAGFGGATTTRGDDGVGVDSGGFDEATTARGSGAGSGGVGSAGFGETAAVRGGAGGVVIAARIALAF